MVRDEGGDRKGERDSRASAATAWRWGAQLHGWVRRAHDRAAVRTPSGKLARWAKDFDFFL